VRWPWSKKPPPPRIPPYTVPVASKPKPKQEAGIEVEEIDAAAVDDQDLAALRAAQSATGLHRAWDRLTGKFKEH
jgi:hypothetical protein